MTGVVEPLAHWQGLRDSLVQQHGRVRRTPLPLGNREDPDEELLFILLTLMTRSQDAIESVYAEILERTGVPPWEGLAQMQRRTLVRILRPVGLVNRRADQLRALARVILDQHDGSLSSLREHADEELLAALEALPGVGRKSARCVAAYSFGRHMLAVDVHVVRVAKRLALVPMESRWAEVDETLNHAVPRRLRYALHVLLVKHGRDVCSCVAPSCSDCALADRCPSKGVASEVREDYIVELRRSGR